MGVDGAHRRSHERTAGRERHRHRPVPAAARSHAEGGAPIGLMEPHVPQARLRSYQGIVPKSDNWRTFGASQEELALRAGIEEDDTERDMAGAAA